MKKAEGGGTRVRLVKTKNTERWGARDRGTGRRGLDREA